MRFPHYELATLKIRVAAADGQKTSSIEGSSQNLKASNLFWDFAIVSVEIFVQFFPSADRRTYWQKSAARFGRPHSVKMCYFLCHSDFTWNQFRTNSNPQIALFSAVFEALIIHFGRFQPSKSEKIQQYQNDSFWTSKFWFW